MTKLLIIGDLDTTGFGTVTMDLGRAMLARGIDVRFVAEVTHDLPEPFASRTSPLGQGWLSITDEGKEHFGRLFSGGAFVDDWTPDTALLIGDPGSLLGNPILRVVPEGFPLWHYAPIEGVGIPPAWGAIWQVAKPITYCEFGAAEIERACGVKPPFVYHGVDTNTFREVSGLRPLVVDHKVLRTKAECKALFGLKPDRVTLLRADRYMQRKAYPSMLRAVMPVLASHPEVDLVIHCKPRDLGGDVRVELSKYGPLAERVLLTGGRMPRETLAALYNAADLYLSSGPEGFGLTIAEALACGVPAVGLDFTAVPEVIGPGGTLVPVGQLVDSIYSYFWAYPDEEKYAEAVQFLVEHKHRRVQLGMLGAMHVKAKFQWSAAAEQFEAIMTSQAVEVAA
jgi:glycosyltransferase involved in cell wall biosynthesis